MAMLTLHRGNFTLLRHKDGKIVLKANSHHLPEKGPKLSHVQIVVLYVTSTDNQGPEVGIKHRSHIVNHAGDDGHNLVAT